VEVRNTPPKAPISSRKSNELIDDLGIALRNVSVFGYDLPNGARVVQKIEEVNVLFAELSKRGVVLDDYIRELAFQTNWQIDALLQDCLAYPKVIPYVRDVDGVRRVFRCNLCRKAEFPADSQLRMCDDCLERTIGNLDNRTPPKGLLFYRTYNTLRRCLHADPETVLVTWDDEEFWETGRCKVCLEEERSARTP
jgi:hypothetical protein